MKAASPSYGTRDRSSVPYGALALIGVVILMIGLLIGGRLGQVSSRTSAKPKSSGNSTNAASFSRGVQLMKSAQAGPDGAVQAAVGFVTAVPDFVSLNDNQFESQIREAVYLDPSVSALTTIRAAINAGRTSLTSMAKFEVAPLWYKVAADPTSGNGAFAVDLVVANVVVDRGAGIADSQWATEHLTMRQQFGSWRVAVWNVSSGIAGTTAFPEKTGTNVENMAQQLDGYKRFEHVALP